MLPKENRLSGKDNFDKVKKEGKICQSESFALLVFKRKEAGPTRIGFIVSNKISKSAVVRNKIKRKLRSVLVSKLSDLKKNNDLVFLAKGKIINKEIVDLRIEITNILDKKDLMRT